MRFGKIPRPFGDEAHPVAGELVRRDLLDVASRRSRPCPWSRASWPLAIFSVVDFPAPFGPSSANTCPWRHDEVEAVDDLDVAVRGPDVRSARRAGRRAVRRGRSTPRALAQHRVECRRDPRRPPARARRPGTPPARRRSPGPRSACPELMILPKSSTWMFSHDPITKPMSCSTSRIARPSAASSRSSAPSAAVSVASSPDDGSSSRSTRGLLAQRPGELDQPLRPGRAASRPARPRRTAARRAR